MKSARALVVSYILKSSPIVLFIRNRSNSMRELKSNNFISKYICLCYQNGKKPKLNLQLSEIQHTDNLLSLQWIKGGGGMPFFSFQKCVEQLFKKDGCSVLGRIRHISRCLRSLKFLVNIDAFCASRVLMLMSL